MARKRAARQGAGPASPSPSKAKSAKARATPRSKRPSKLSKLVSALKSGAASIAKQARGRRRAARAKPSASPKAPQTPLAKRSVVRAPARRPTARSKRPAAAPRARKPARRALVPLPTPSATAPAPRGWEPERSPAAPASSISHAARATLPEEQFSIPTGYGDDRIVLLVKDPWWVYAYWEIQPTTERSARTQLLPHEVGGLQSVLRVYDVTGMDASAPLTDRYFDIGLSGLATNWYIHTNAPGRQFVVEIGLLTNTGRFLRLARSNRVATPRFGPADEIDEKWMVTDETYWKLFGATSGLGGSSGLTQALSQQLSSGAWSSYGLTGAGKHQAMLKGFTFRVDHDLVIHGAAEPKAMVTIQGQPVAVRKDGSFSLRVALPEGAQTVTIDVRSADGRQSKTVTPVISLSGTEGLTPHAPKHAATEPTWPKLEPRTDGG